MPKSLAGVLCILQFVLGAVFAASLGREAIGNLKTEAIAQGHAEYTVDAEGSVTFKWKEPCNKEKTDE